MIQNVGASEIVLVLVLPPPKGGTKARVFIHVVYVGSAVRMWGRKTGRKDGNAGGKHKQATPVGNMASVPQGSSEGLCAAPLRIIRGGEEA